MTTETVTTSDQQLDTGKLKSVVAVCADGTIVGHTGLTLNNPDAGVAEAGNTVVDPEYRGAGILGEMGSALAQLCRSCAFVGYVHYPTAAHDVMQRRSVTNGGVETGVMLGYVPAETDYRAIDQSSGRIAATIAYQPLVEARSLRIYVPHRYEMLLGRLYGQMGLRRERLQPSTQPRAHSDATSTHSSRRSLLNVAVERSGADLAAVVQRSIKKASAQIAHVDLTLDDPGIDQAVNELAALGFVYCGMLPDFARSDILRLQWLGQQPPSVFAPELANSGAREILAIINAEAQSAA